MEKITNWSEDYPTLNTAIEKEMLGIEREKILRMSQMFEDIGTTSSLIPVSAKTDWGLDGLYGELQRVFAGGEDFESDD